jgi:Tol biopolymer transport system component
MMFRTGTRGWKNQKERRTRCFKTYVTARSGGIAERDPSWSPDGHWLAYFSDANGEYELTITRSDGSGTPRQLTHLGTGFRYRPT